MRLLVIPFAFIACVSSLTCAPRGAVAAASVPVAPPPVAPPLTSPPSASPSSASPSSASPPSASPPSPLPSSASVERTYERDRREAMARIRVDATVRSYFFSTRSGVARIGPYLVVAGYGTRFVFPATVAIVDAESGRPLPESRLHDDLGAGYAPALLALPPTSFRSGTCPDCVFTGTIEASRSQYYRNGDPDIDPRLRDTMRRANAAATAAARQKIVALAHVDPAPVYCPDDGLMQCGECGLRMTCTASLPPAGAGPRAAPVCDLPRAAFDAFSGLCFLIDPAVPDPFAPQGSR